MKYVDGFVLAVPTKNIAAYRKMASAAGKVWRKHGALEYVEATGDDLKASFCLSFKDLVKPKRGETILFSWIVYKSRAHRDQVNKKVMADPHMKKMMEKGPMPFDLKRMAFGGFKFLVEA
jgi:uncharacterized protein YbaA (DUF1428 family)